MKGNKNMVLLMLLLTVAVMITGCGSKMKTSEKLTAEHAILIEEKEAEEEAVISTKQFSSAKDLTVEKVERTIVEDGEGNAQTSYDTYLVSDVSLSKGMDKTDSYAKAMADGEFAAWKSRRNSRRRPYRSWYTVLPLGVNKGHMRYHMTS